MRSLLTVAAAITTVLAFNARAGDATPVNALWNDTKGFGIWMYGRPDDCKTLDYKNPPYVVFGDSTKKREQFPDGVYSVALPNTCLAVTKTDVPVCSKGTVALKYERESNEVVGEYDLVLANGEVWKGKFRAERCK